MDFFSAASAADRVSASATGDFANAIANRYATASGAPAAQTPDRALPPQTPYAAGEIAGADVVISPSIMAFPSLGSMSLLSSPGTKRSTTAPAGAVSRFHALAPAELPGMLADSNVLLVDLRPHTSYALGRVRGAVGLSAPTMLLRRPASTLAKLASMVTPGAMQARFAAWARASVVVLYDADSGSVTPGSALHGLLGKFVAEGCGAEKLRWVQGGFHAIWTDCPAAVDSQSPVEEAEAAPTTATGASAAPTAAGLLLGRRLPTAAFAPSSAAASSRGTNSATSPSGTQPLLSPHQAASNPFFDNIRQNIELAGNRPPRGDASSSSRISLRLPPYVKDCIDTVPLEWLRLLARRAKEEQEGRTVGKPLSDEFAGQFHAIELEEQQRLMGVMDHHSREGGIPDLKFPYGITAGIEKGSKNRYRNIWPFEHSRVQLLASKPKERGSGRNAAASDFDDYINASHVQPLGTRRRYIATQGPLEATFADFWTLVWQQNVHVIVMLTREREGAQIKCANYWLDGRYGRLRLRSVSSSGTPPPEVERNKGGFFTAEEATPVAHTVKRVFELTNEDCPHIRPRKITHIQYLGWDDMNIPEDAHDVLNIVHEVDAAMREVQQLKEKRPAAEGSGAWGEGLNSGTGVVRGDAVPPVLLHCSAGIGRTGGFIALDAILDGVRQEIRAAYAAQPRSLVFSSSPRGEQDDARTRSTRLVDPFLSEARRPVVKRWISGVGEPGGTGERSVAKGAQSEDRAQPSSAWSSGAGGRRSPSLSQQPRTNASPPSRSSGGLLDPFAPPTADSRSSPPSLPASPGAGAALPPKTSANAEGSSWFHQPRRLHQREAPTALSSLDAPIWRVVSDMREQRMSLCQSLRQYVFVHLAVLQGAVDIVEEEGGGRRRLG